MRHEVFGDLIDFPQCHAPGSDAAEAARERIERNLHDGLQQRLVSVAMSLGLLDAKLPSEPQVAKEIAREARQRLALALAELREVTEGRDPAAVANRGLGGALEELCRGAGIPAQLRLSVDRRLPAHVEAAAFYMVSEAMTNAVKHSHARKLRVAASYDGDLLSVEVADDGVGGAGGDRRAGLKGLVARIEELGGSLRVSSPVGEGTALRARIPCRSRFDRRVPADRNGNEGGRPTGSSPAHLGS